MRCWRIDIRRKLTPYVHHELSQDTVKRVEDHLVGCGECRATLARIRTGHKLAGHLPMFKPELDRWAAIERAIEAAPVPTPSNSSSANSNEPAATISVRVRIILATLSLAVIGLSMIVLAYRQDAPTDANYAVLADRLDLARFHPVSIAHIETSTKPHVVAEGYVSEVRSDSDGDLTFRLVDDLKQPGPFIVCEIVEPIRLEAPRVGSRVRVYGVSRYDGQQDRNWWEVHPVLNIEVLHR